MPNMQKIKAAFELGQRTRRVNLCSEVFELLTARLIFPSPTLTQGRLSTVEVLERSAQGSLLVAHCAVSSSPGCAELSAPSLVFSAAPLDICAQLPLVKTLNLLRERQKRGLEIQ